MRVVVIIAVLLALTGCGSEGSKSGQADGTDTAAVKRCTERFLARAQGDRTAVVQTYVERTYCAPFARRGWLYPDGTLSINAHLFILNGGSCTSTSATPGGQTTTLPCDPAAGLLDPLECAILHIVRRSEVRTYIRKLSRSQEVKCDDGTPLDKLGS